MPNSSVASAYPRAEFPPGDADDSGCVSAADEALYPEYSFCHTPPLGSPACDTVASMVGSPGGLEARLVELDPGLASLALRVRESEVSHAMELAARDEEICELRAAVAALVAERENLLVALEAAELTGLEEGPAGVETVDGGEPPGPSSGCEFLDDCEQSRGRGSRSREEGQSVQSSEPNFTAEEGAEGPPAEVSDVAAQGPQAAEPPIRPASSVVVEEVVRGVARGIEGVDLAPVLSECGLDVALRYALGGAWLPGARVESARATAQVAGSCASGLAVSGVPPGEPQLRARTVLDVEARVSLCGLDVPLRVQVAHGLADCGRGGASSEDNATGALNCRKVVRGRSVRVAFHLGGGAAALPDGLRKGLLAGEEWVESKLHGWLHWLEDAIREQVLKPCEVTRGGLWPLLAGKAWEAIRGVAAEAPVEDVDSATFQTPCDDLATNVERPAFLDGDDPSEEDESSAERSFSAEDAVEEVDGAWFLEESGYRLWEATPWDDLL